MCQILARIADPFILRPVGVFQDEMGDQEGNGLTLALFGMMKIGPCAVVNSDTLGINMKFCMW